MIYIIKEKFWSLGGKYTIRDRDDVVRFLAVGKPFSWGAKVSFQVPDGRELAFISQKMFSWLPRFQIYVEGQLFAEVVKQFSWFKKRFVLDVPGPNDYVIDGSFWDREFLFTRNGRQVARVSKSFWGFTDKYGVEIEEGENDATILCTCIVIDKVIHAERQNH